MSAPTVEAAPNYWHEAERWAQDVADAATRGVYGWADARQVAELVETVLADAEATRDRAVSAGVPALVDACEGAARGLRRAAGVLSVVLGSVVAVAESGIGGDNVLVSG